MNADLVDFLGSWLLRLSTPNAGRNQLAVEVQEANAASSDLSFDLELIAEW